MPESSSINSPVIARAINQPDDGADIAPGCAVADALTKVLWLAGIVGAQSAPYKFS